MFFDVIQNQVDLGTWYQLVGYLHEEVYVVSSTDSFR
jgi:hypothetical protein